MMYLVIVLHRIQMDFIYYGQNFESGIKFFLGNI